MRVLSACLGVAVLAGWAAAQQVAFNNFGPGDTYDGTAGGTVRGPLASGGALWHAIKFESQASGAITDVHIALVTTSTTVLNLYALELWSNQNDLPGVLIGELGQLSAAQHATPINPPPHLAAGGSVQLTAGTTYWLVAKGEGDAAGSWRRNVIGDTGFRAFSSNSGASWSLWPVDRYAFRIVVGEACYANCDRSTTPPILNVEDFTCFINEFAAAQALPHEQQLGHYANCDGSSTPPVLNVEDFTCFINRFAAGCP
jgi:hypothetical protein